MTQFAATMSALALVAIAGSAVTQELSPSTNAPSGSLMNEVGHSVAPDIAVTPGGPDVASRPPEYTWGDAIRDVAIGEAVGLATDEATRQLAPLLSESFGARTGGYLSSSAVGVVSSLAYGKGFGSALLGAAISTAKQVGLDQLRETPAGSVVASTIETAEAVQSFVGFVSACSQSGPACLAGAPTQVRTLHALGRSWHDTVELLTAEDNSTLKLGDIEVTTADLVTGWYDVSGGTVANVANALVKAGYLDCTGYAQACNAAAHTLYNLTHSCRSNCTPSQLANACAPSDAACQTVINLITDRKTMRCLNQQQCGNLANGGTHPLTALDPEQLITALQKLAASGALPEAVAADVIANLPGGSKHDEVLVASGITDTPIIVADSRGGLVKYNTRSITFSPPGTQVKLGVTLQVGEPDPKFNGKRPLYVTLQVGVSTSVGDGIPKDALSISAKDPGDARQVSAKIAVNASVPGGKIELSFDPSRLADLARGADAKDLISAIATYGVLGRNVSAGVKGSIEDGELVWRGTASNASGAGSPTKPEANLTGSITIKISPDMVWIPDSVLELLMTPVPLVTTFPNGTNVPEIPGGGSQPSLPPAK